MFIYGRNIVGDNLYAKNCEAGFLFVGIKDSKFTRIMTDNTEVPIYMTTGSDNFTIEIERSTKFYFVDWNAWYMDILDIMPGPDVSMSYITELGMPGYFAEFTGVGTYHFNLTLIRQIHHNMFTYESRANFTVISVPRYPRPDIFNVIRSFPFAWYWVITVIGLLSLIELSRRFYQK